MGAARDHLGEAAAALARIRSDRERRTDEEERDRLQRAIRRMQGGDRGAAALDDRALPTLDAFADLLPGGALRAGGVYSVHASVALAIGLTAGAVQAGRWCGVLGVPEFGAESASRLGVDLSRVALVPDPGPQWLQVASALVDVLDVVVARPGVRLTGAEAARFAGRLRERESAFVVLGDWPRAEARLEVVESRWEGLGAGHGYLSGRVATVETRARGVRFARRTLWLPGPEGFAITTDGPRLAAVPDPTARRGGPPAAVVQPVAARLEAV